MTRLLRRSSSGSFDSAPKDLEPLCFCDVVRPPIIGALRVLSREDSGHHNSHEKNRDQAKLRPLVLVGFFSLWF